MKLVEPVPLTPADNALDSLFSAHRGKVSDKWSSYIPEYARLFSAYRDLPIRLLEIGIQNGGSLEIWSKYFANAKKVVGCDINPECAKLQFENPRIVVIAADANTDGAQQQVLRHAKNFDLIIDDGSHRSSDIVYSFARYFPHLSDGGLYVVEDLHCSYWQRYEGGIFRPHSAMTFFKQLADILNHEHWGIGKVRSALLRNFEHLEDTRLDDATLAHVHSIEFINSMCVVKKAPPSQNMLGKRLVVGQTALVDSEPLPFNGSSSSPQDQSSNYWSMRDLMAAEDPIPTLQEIDKLNEQLISLRQQLERQSHSIAGIEAENTAQLLRIRLDHAQQLGDLQAQFAARDQSFMDQLAQARQLLENSLCRMAEREGEFSVRLQQIEATHSKQSEERSVRSAAREQYLMDQLMQAQQHREGERREREDLQAQLQAKQEEIKALSRDLDGIQASYSWRLTAPFRRRIVASRKPLATNTTPTTNGEPSGMNSTLPDTTAMTLAQLVSHQDARFVQCAYETLLNRQPDNEGMRFYLSSVRAGTSKLEILSQIRLSPEGQAKHTDVAGLDEAIKRHRRRKLPILGALLRLFGGADAKGDRGIGARKLEDSLYLLDVQMKRGFTDIGASLGHLKRLIEPTDNASPGNILPSAFDPVWYVQQYPDAAESSMTPYDHYMTLGKDEGRYPVFDNDWYLAQYPDVAASGMTAREHYDICGRAEGRFPCFDANWYLKTYQDVAAAGLDARTHYILRGKAQGRYPAYTTRNDYKKWIAEFDVLATEMRADMREQCSRFASKPLISVIMPVYNPNPVWLKEAIESVINQIYPNWELCIADDLSTEGTIRPMLERYAALDERIKVVFRPENGHISAASNSALKVASGAWIALLDHDDILTENALFWVADAINKYANVRMIYSDEDKITDRGFRFDPYFKCDWNVDLFYSHNMFSHLGVYDASLINAVGGFRVGLEGSQDYDLALRCSELIDATQIHHIPRVLYHWREHADSTALSATAKPYAAIAAENAINEHLVRRGVKAKAEATEFGYRVRYSLPERLPLVSLIIPTRNGWRLLRQCVDSILKKTTYQPYEILIVDNGSDDPETLRYMKDLSLNERIRVVRDNRPFNFSALNNAAVKLASGEFVGLVNNDIEVISPEWLTEMVSHAMRPEVGAVGAKLWYENDTLQHGGVILGLGGVAGHAHKHLPKQDPGYKRRADCIQSLSAVTAACLLIRKAIYESIGGLNEDLSVAFNDVDFCIRVREAGYRNIWTPYAELYHHESASRGPDDTPAKKARFAREIKYMQSRWAAILKSDPAYSPNLTIASEDFSYAWPPRVEKFILSARNTQQLSAEDVLQQRQ
jgi:glycosyltransferase involved in cell wall biosynthesis